MNTKNGRTALEKPLVERLTKAYEAGEIPYVGKFPDFKKVSDIVDAYYAEVYGIILADVLIGDLTVTVEKEGEMATTNIPQFIQEYAHDYVMELESKRCGWGCEGCAHIGEMYDEDGDCIYCSRGPKEDRYEEE